MKRVIVCLLLVCFVIGCSHKQSTEEQLYEQTTQLSALLANNSFEYVYEHFSSDLKNQRSAEDFAAYMRAAPRWNHEQYHIQSITLVNTTQGYIIMNVSGAEFVLESTYQGGMWKYTGFYDAFTGICPTNCVDGDPCTTDVCSAKTKFVCQHTRIDPCTGNGECEVGEYGTTDCPNCRDYDICTKDQYNYQFNQCEHVPLEPCCGNHICETNETRRSCRKDCAGIIFTLGRGEVEEQTLQGNRYEVYLQEIRIPQTGPVIARFTVNGEGYGLPITSNSSIAPGIFVSFDFLTTQENKPGAAIAIYEAR